MLHHKSIHQSKLLQALQKKRMNSKMATEPIVSKPETQAEHVSYLVPEPVKIQQEISLPTEEFQPTEPIVDTTISAKKLSPEQKLYEKKISIPFEQSEVGKLFEEFEQFKYEQQLWNKLHGK